MARARVRGLTFVLLLLALFLAGCSSISTSPNVRVIATPAPLTGEGARAALRLVPAPTSCCGPEVTRVVGALYDTPGIVKFRISRTGVITLIYDPRAISLREIKELVSRASGLQVVTQVHRSLESERR